MLAPKKLRLPLSVQRARKGSSFREGEAVPTSI